MVIGQHQIHDGIILTLIHSERNRQRIISSREGPAARHFILVQTEWRGPDRIAECRIQRGWFFQMAWSGIDAISAQVRGWPGFSASHRFWPSGRRSAPEVTDQSFQAAMNQAAWPRALAMSPAATARSPVDQLEQTASPTQRCPGLRSPNGPALAPAGARLHHSRNAQAARVTSASCRGPVR